MAERIRTQTIVPAAPGWFVVTLDEDEMSLDLDPIIAWEIERKEVLSATRAPPDVAHTIVPLTTLRGIDSTVIKRPDGKFTIDSLYTVDTEAEAIAFLRREDARLAGRRA